MRELVLDPGPNGQAHDNWNEAMNADDDGQESFMRVNRL
ncbi:Uncharacterised protein [Nocardia otitidiscaviarum]|uniref:Uncharacterized protein n=1 Tax=Nocardia otitidiscaviarum TaxID=1823 RepID=A0A379JJD5_9NOCA|nr:Uncharacterised protein [Nocardia otitidiscaviarum]